MPGLPVPRDLDGISMWDSLIHNKTSRRETIYHNIDEDPLEETFQVGSMVLWRCPYCMLSQYMFVPIDQLSL